MFKNVFKTSLLCHVNVQKKISLRRLGVTKDCLQHIIGCSDWNVESPISITKQIQKINKIEPEISKWDIFKPILISAIWHDDEPCGFFTKTADEAVPLLLLNIFVFCSVCFQIFHIWNNRLIDLFQPKTSTFLYALSF